MDEDPDEVLPATLRWHSTRPVYRDDPQDRVTVILRMPGYHDPPPRDDDAEWCPGRYHCVTHDRPWWHGGEHCPAHDHHEIAWLCDEHGFENLSLQPEMRDDGLDPPPSEWPRRR